MIMIYAAWTRELICSSPLFFAFFAGFAGLTRLDSTALTHSLTSRRSRRDAPHGVAVMKTTSSASPASASTTQIRTMLITLSARSLVLSSLIILLSVNTSSTFQYDWVNIARQPLNHETNTHTLPACLPLPHFIFSCCTPFPFLPFFLTSS